MEVAPLLNEGHFVTNIDLLPTEARSERLQSVVGDFRNRELLGQLLQSSRHDAVLHCAAILAHGVSNLDELWSSNVDGTEVLAQAVAEAGVPGVVTLLAIASGDPNSRGPSVKMTCRIQWRSTAKASGKAREFCSASMDSLRS